MHNFYGEQYLVPSIIMEGFTSPEYKEDFIIREQKAEKESRDFFKRLGVEDEVINKEFRNAFRFVDFQDMYKDDSIVTIMNCKNNMISWIDTVNEIDVLNNCIHVYRKGSKYGFYNENGLQGALFDAISNESPDGKICVAMFEYIDRLSVPDSNNLNFINNSFKYIHYYTFNDGELTRIEDDWNIFNPTKCKWIPYDFLDDNYDIAYSHDGFYCNTEEWTDEDAWDAMTDGMYGDYPGSGWDSEMFGY